MLKKAPAPVLAALVIGLGALGGSTGSLAGGFNPMDMMNPSKMFGGKKDRYGPGDVPPPPPGGMYPGGAGPYGAPGYGAPPPGYGAPVAPGMAGAPPAAYGAPVAPGYGAPAAPGYGAAPYAAPGYGAPAPAPAASAPPSGPSKEDMADRIQRLEARIQQMEAERQPPAPVPGSTPPASYQYYSGDQTPAKYPFRPMDQGR